MKSNIFLIGLLLLTLAAVDAYGQGNSDRLRPKWMKQVPVSRSADVKFVKVLTPVGSTSADELGRLVVNLPGNWHVSTSASDVQIMETVSDGKHTSDVVKMTATIKTKADGEPVSIRCVREGGFVKGNQSWALYQVAKTNGASFIDCYETEEYGAAGCLLSIIPGCGQFYKGDPLKGTLFLGGCAAGGLGVVFAEMQRQSYISQISQTHDINVIKQLDANQKNMAIVRNVCIGATAALYIWNLIDGAAAPGARRIVFTGDSLRYNF